ncbi:glutathione peroxidase [Flavobacterium humi]|uniref:Glutathione peroxidase n=1 Tax=Flavobacterium humi TaxID=2562683 RepID=A0A4Z0L8X9_9FLAO|nr:glutathione peroxidase [Flavobacterium humi]
MRKILLIVLMGVVTLSCKNQEDNIKNRSSHMADIQENMEGETIYQFKVTDIDGKEFDFASLKGKKVMIVNTASKCGLTPQYEQLQALYDEFKADNFVVVGFPSNSFEDQEPGTNAEIATFCKKNYGVSFPMMGKVSVKGADMDPLYQFLTQKSKNGLEDNTVKWNFQKYLINENGHLDKIIAPQVVPIDETIMDWIK